MRGSTAVTPDAGCGEVGVKEGRLVPNHRGPAGEAAMVAVLELTESIMNANLSFAASGAPAFDSCDSRTRAGSGSGSGSESGSGSGSVASLERLDAYRVGLEAHRSSQGIAVRLDANLRDQIRRASSSVVLNTAEGFGSRSAGVKRRHYEIARGSAIECVAILDLSTSVPDVDPRVVRESRELFSRVAMMLARLEARFR